MSTSTWTGAINRDWDDTDNWSPAGVPGASSDVVITTGPSVQVSGSIGTVNSITDSYALGFESAGTNTVATFLDITGHLYVDSKAGAGGTILNIGGTLTNRHHLTIGNATLSAPDEVTAASLDNTGDASLNLTGSSANQALLDVTAGLAGFGTAGVLSGYARLAGDSAIEFASGEITSLADYSHLGLVGSDAFIEDSSATGSNSALMGLASIGADALFALHDGASVSTTGALVNDGNVYLDFAADDGGSSLTVGGTLTNSGTLSIGNTTLSASDEVRAASLDNPLDNTGSISLTGSSADQALLDVTGAAGFGAAGVLRGHVQLSGDSAIEFASGEITRIGASSVDYFGSGLTLSGNSAFIEDSTAPGSNSALAGLAEIGSASTFTLADGASVSTTGALTNSGFLNLDYQDNGGGSTLSIGGALTNTNMLDIGNGVLSSSDSVTANSFVNRGDVDLIGGKKFAALNVSGATTNNDFIRIDSDTEELAGPVGGTGGFSLNASNLQFDSSVSSGQTINVTGADKLTLEQAQSFAATISGFGTGDTIDATNFVETGTTYNFVENSAMTGGTLTLTDTSQSLTANIQMTGHYSNSSFTLASDSGTGTLVKFV